MFILSAHYQYDGCWNGYNYDCCRNRRPGLFYPSLVKPLPYYYRCVHRRVVYGRCESHLCVNNHGICGKCCIDTYPYWCTYNSDKPAFKCVCRLPFSSVASKWCSLGRPNIRNWLYRLAKIPPSRMWLNVLCSATTTIRTAQSLRQHLE